MKGKLISTGTEQGHGSDTSGDAKSPSKEELISREQLDGSPFFIVGDGSGFFLVMGKHRLTDKFDSRELLLEWVESNTWNLVCVVVGVCYEGIKEFEKFDIKEPG